MTSRAPDQTWEPRYASRAAGMRASDIRELLKLLDQPGIISLAGGIPDPVLFCRAAVEEAYRAVLSDAASASGALQYSASEGWAPLRQWIVGHMARLGVACEEDNVVITSGSQQGLDFLARLLLSPGDTALVCAPTYLGALQAFAAYQPRYDELGSELSNRTARSYADAAACNGGSVKFAYVVPDFANPTGETLSLGARERLLDLAAELDMCLIEDAAYSALRFAGEAVPAMQALDCQRCGGIERARTIYCGTFSKTLSPGLRVGWIVAAKPLIRRLVLIKQASDLNCATINQIVMHRLAETTYAEQVVRAQGHYAGRRDAMLAALKTYMPTATTWTRPQGGLFVWVRLPEGCDGAGLLPRAVAAGVAFVPGSAFFFDGRGANTMRLSYSLASETQIDKAIERLASLL